MNEPRYRLSPDDVYNQSLVDHVHPQHWKNPLPAGTYHLVIIGAGTAGLVTAAAAAGLGARVALIERDLMGGDCLNFGCVPSKAIISAARVAASVRNAAAFGVQIPHGTNVDFGKVMQRMRAKRALISPVDSAARFRDLGVDVFFGQGRFETTDTISVTDREAHVSKISFRKAVIATGARAAAPPIPGLETVEYLTNENLFSLTQLPARLAVIGSGPIGSEMAQCFARLGSQVVLFEMSDRILPREDADASAILQRQLQRDGVVTVLNSKDMELARAEEPCIQVRGVSGSEPYRFEVDQLLVAVGRAANTEGLNLTAVGVESNRQGIPVNDHLQTSNPRIYAAGDICSPLKFTHAADFQARIVVQNALFAVGPFGRKKASDLVVPWATYTSPEIAHVGLSEQDAAAAGTKIDTYIQSLEHVDRAILDDHQDGFVKVHTRRGSDRIVGATIVAEHAGDMISEVVVAMTNGVGLAGIGAAIHPYPTTTDAIRRLGDQYNRTRLTAFNQKLLSLLRRLNVGR